MDDLGRSSPAARRGAAARWWLLLIGVVAVLVAGAVAVSGAVLGVSSTDLPPVPSDSPTDRVVPPTPSPSLAPSRSGAEPGAPVLVRPGRGPLLPGVGTGQVYAQSATGIFRIDLGTGRITRTATPDLQEHVTFLAGRHWVLVKSRWSPTGVFVRDGQPAAPLPQEFDPEGSLHLGPGGRLWVEPEGSTDPRPSTTLRLAELDGRPVPGRTVTAPRSAAPYAIVADGYGGILLTNRGGIYRLEPSRPGRASRIRLLSRGDLIGAGGGRLLVWDCGSDARCQVLLVDQRTRHRSSRPAAARTLLADHGIGIDPTTSSESQLSPDGSHLALMAPDSTGKFRVRVVNLHTGGSTVLPGAGADVNANRQLAWSPNSRWLLALTDHQITGYNTLTRATGKVPLSEGLLHLTTANTPGW